MPTERFQFDGANGEKLAAALDLPDGQPHAYALFAHCFSCGKETHAARRIAMALAAHGIAVLRFDFTGLGSSEGDFANTTFSSNVADLVRAADHLRETRAAPALLIGHSLGGAAVLAAAAEIPETKAVVTIAAPSDPARPRRRLVQGQDRGHPRPRRGRGLARRPAVPHQPLLSR
jgi:putative redox protein